MLNKVTSTTWDSVSITMFRLEQQPDVLCNVLEN